jgi:hypothetical protein
MVASAWSAVVTVPEPSRHFVPYSFLSSFSRVHSAGDGHGDLDYGDAAGEHGLHDGVGLAGVARAQNRDEADAFQGLGCGFGHGFLFDAASVRFSQTRL